MPAKIVVVLVAIVSLALASASPSWAQTLATYDAFDSVLIKPLKWYGDEQRSFGGNQTETRRAIQAGRVRLENRTWGDRYNAVGNPSAARNSLVALASPAITVMRATIVPRALDITDCPTSEFVGSVRARLFGFFFNAGESIAGNSVDDVFAAAQIHRTSASTDAPGLFRVIAYVGICLDEPCLGASSLGSVDLGTVALNTPITLEIRWEPGNSRFSFQRDANARVRVAYTVRNRQAASWPVKRLDVTNQVPRCRTRPRPASFLAAEFDDVMVNESALAADAPGLASPAADAAAEPPVDGVVAP